MSDESGTGQIAKALGVTTVGLRYEDGGKVQVVFLPDGTEYRFPDEYHSWDIIAAINLAKEQGV